MFITIFLMMSRVLGDDGYCSMGYRRLCQGKGMHVACQFPTAGPGPFCQNYTRVVMTKRMQRFITDDINRRRQHLAAGQVRVRDGEKIPQPQAMMLVSWDEELAFLAQRLADQCQFAHDDCRATVRYPYAGQSVGEVRLRKPYLNIRRLVSRVVDAWWSEKTYVRVDQLMAPFRPVKGQNWGHFSQLAIWDLTSVGCGAVTHSTAMLLVCDFSHTNMLGQVTLRPGPVGDCPGSSKRRTEFPLLCAPITPKSNSVEGDRDVQEDTGRVPEYPRVKDAEVTKRVYEGLKLPSAPKWRRTKTKWNQRTRPTKLMPNVLLKNRPVIISASRQPSIALNLDKEDLEQLYKDTGFRVHANRPASLNK